MPSVSPHDLVKGAPPGLHEPFHGGWLIMQGDIEAYEVEERSVGVDRWRWAMPALYTHELELYAMDQATQTLVKEPADVLDLTNCKVMNALPRRGRLNLIGVSVTAGNAALRDTLANAKSLLRLAGVKLEPAAGASYRDMHVPWPGVRRLHNVRGDVASSPDAVAAIRSAVRARPPHSLTIVKVAQQR